VNTVPIRDVCTRSAATIDIEDLWRNGAYAVWIGSSGQILLQSVAQTLGDRPWVLDRMRDSIRTGSFVSSPSEDNIDEEAADTADATTD
jgi:hypothetical protein